MIRYKQITIHRPEAVRLDEYSVYVATNITEVTVIDDILDEEPTTHTEYHYDETRYTKDEYIKLKLSEQGDAILELADIIGGML